MTMLSGIRHASLSTKIAVTLAVPILALLFFAANGMFQKRSVAAEMGELQSLTRPAVEVSALVHELQKERGLSGGFLATAGAKFRAELTAQRSDVDERLAPARASLERPEMKGAGAVGEAGAAALAALGQLRAKRDLVSALTLTADESLDFYSAAIDALLEVVTAISRRASNVEVAQALISYDYFLHLKERCGIERAILNGAFAADKIGKAHFRRFCDNAGEQSAFAEVFLSLALEEQRTLFAARVSGGASGEVERLKAIAFERADHGAFGVDPAAWFRAATAKIDALKEVEDRLAADLVRRTAELKGEATLAFNLFGGIAILAVAGALALGYVMSRAVALPLAAASEATREIASQLVAAVQQHSASAAQTATSVAETSTTLEEIRKTAELAVQKTKVLADTAERGTGAAKEGLDAIGQGVEAMNRIRSEVDGIARNIMELSEKNLQIGEIVQSVNDLAEQSNLLAVNASIEAAKAGEHGKGFAVVAGEVKALAVQSKESTGQIRSILAEIQKSSNGAVMVTEQGSKRVEEGSRLIDELGKTIRMVSGVNAAGADAAGQIATAANQQLLGIEQINEAMRAIEQASKETAAGVQQIEHSARRLKDVSDQLVETVRGRSNGA